MGSPAQPTDAELATRAQDGDRQAADDLVRRYIPLVRRLLGKLRVPDYVDYDELESAGLIGLWNAVKAWKPTKVSTKTGSPVKFLTYCYIAINNELHRTAGKLSKPRLTITQQVGDEEDGFALESITDRERRDSPEPPAELTQALASLDPVSREVVTLAYGLDGPSPGWKTIAERVGLTVPQAKRALELAIASF